MSESDGAQTVEDTFDESMLAYLVCPLAKTPLRFDKESNTLVNDELGVHYPIQNGIPNLIPQQAKKGGTD